MTGGDDNAQKKESSSLSRVSHQPHEGLQPAAAYRSRPLRLRQQPGRLLVVGAATDAKWLPPRN